MSVLHFKALNCVTLPHSGASFLKVDSAIDCDSEDYEDFSNVVILGILGTERAHFLISPYPKNCGQHALTRFLLLS